MNEIDRLLDRLLTVLPGLPEVTQEDIDGDLCAAIDRRREDPTVVRHCRLCARVARSAMFIDSGPLVDDRARWLDLCPQDWHAVVRLVRDYWPGDTVVLQRFQQLQARKQPA